MNPSAGKIRDHMLAAVALLFCSGLACADTAQLARDSAVLAEPLSNAAVVTQARAGDALTVDAREGAWARITTGQGQSGYVRLLNLRTSSGQRGQSGAGQLVNVFRTGASGTSVSTGVKGLSEEDLTDAKPDRKQVKKLAKFQVDEKEARQSAAGQGLEARDVNWLPEPDTKKED